MSGGHSPVYAADDKEVGIRMRALIERAQNICHRRLSPPKPSSECWCKILSETESELPCPPTYEEPK